MRLWQERLMKETGGVIPTAGNQPQPPISSQPVSAPQTQPEQRRGLFGLFGRKNKQPPSTHEPLDTSEPHPVMPRLPQVPEQKPIEPLPKVQLPLIESGPAEPLHTVPNAAPVMPGPVPEPEPEPVIAAPLPAAEPESVPEPEPEPKPEPAPEPAAVEAQVEAPTPEVAAEPEPSAAHPEAESGTLVAEDISDGEKRVQETPLAAEPAPETPKPVLSEPKPRKRILGIFARSGDKAATKAVSQPRVRVKAKVKSKNAAPREEFRKGEGPGRVITFWSPKSEGATTTALGVAQELARRGKQVWLFDLNLRRPSMADCLEPNLTLTGWDTLWPMVQAGTLTPDHIDAILWKPKKGMTMAPILGGLSHSEYAANFLPDAFERLISVAQKRCEYVIIDVGADLDNAGTEACLKNNYATFVVLRPVWLSLKTYRDAQRILNLLGIDHSRFKLVVTSRREDGAYTNREVEKFCGNPVAVTVPYYAELDKAFGMCVFPDQLERTKEQADYLAAMQELADLITAR